MNNVTIKGEKVWEVAGKKHPHNKQLEDKQLFAEDNP